jgi:hypothetical protein
MEWRGQFTGHHGVPTMILEAVASYDLRIWHAYFGVAGSNNDINVLNRSPLFISTLKGEAPRVQYTVNGRQYDTGYYLADGIYPEWATFVKSIPLPQNDKNKLFAKLQEGARKDVERAFAPLQSRFSIVNRPAKFWKRAAIGSIMQACVILHNMIVEDERKPFNTPLDLNRNPEISSVLPPEVVQGAHPVFEDVLVIDAAHHHVVNPRSTLLSLFSRHTDLSFCRQRYKIIIYQTKKWAKKCTVGSPLCTYFNKWRRIPRALPSSTPMLSAKKSSHSPERVVVQ